MHVVLQAENAWLYDRWCIITLVQRFTQDNRLRKADEFSSVFLFRRVLHGKYIKIHYRPNALNYSRLGLVVGKRIHKKANRRNYMKRLLRELFRQNNQNLLASDMIIRVVNYFDYSSHLEVIEEFRVLSNKIKSHN
jgi:ribonuclease P protein component